MTTILDYTTEKVDCSVCYDQFPSALECHSVCGTCVRKHFKQECPVCRQPHSLQIEGTRPFYQKDEIEKDKPEKTLKEIYEELRKKQKKLKKQRTQKKTLGKILQKKTQWNAKEKKITIFSFAFKKAKRLKLYLCIIQISENFYTLYSRFAVFMIVY